MKSELKNKENKKEELQFPVLMKYKGYGFIVLFENYSSGTVVWKGDGSWDIGHHRDDWLSCGIGAWEKVDCIVELSN